MSHLATLQTTTIAAAISTGDADHVDAYTERVRTLRLQGHDVTTWTTDAGELAVSWAEIDQSPEDGTTVRSHTLLFAPNAEAA